MEDKIIYCLRLALLSHAPYSVPVAAAAVTGRIDIRHTEVQAVHIRVIEPSRRTVDAEGLLTRRSGIVEVASKSESSPRILN